MKATKITSKNFVTNLNSTDDAVPVRGLHYNNLKDDFDAHITADGVGAFDTIGEYTSGNGTTITTLKQDVIAEKTAGAGVTVDGALIKDGIFAKRVTATASSGGTGTGLLAGADQFVTVYANHANDIIALPTLSAALIGTIIRGHTSVTGCEIRTSEHTGGIFINDVSGATEAAIPADTTFKAEAVTVTDWILTSVDGVGTVVAITPD